MEEQGFDWDDANTEHVGRHRVKPSEVEEAILDPGAIITEEQNTEEEERFNLVGRTHGGKILSAVFTMREGLIRPITAYKAPKRDQATYLKGNVI